MKKYLKMLPVLLYPYIYMLVANINPILEKYELTQELAKKFYIFDPLNALIIAIVVHLIVLLCQISFIVNAVRGNYTSKDCAKMTMIIKLVHIPAFLLHFLYGALGFLASVWGLAFITFAIVIDLLTIIQTGIMSITTAVKCTKDKVFSPAYGVIFSILGFIYCIDVGASIYVFIKARTANKNGVPSA